MNTIITITHEYASGGRVIAQKAAELLNFPVYDKEILTLTAEKSGFTEDFVKEAAEKKTASFLYGLYMTSLPVSDQLFLVQSEVIRSLAAKGSCVIVGAAADYVLRDFQTDDTRLLKVFVHSPPDSRLARLRENCSQYEKCGDEDTRAHIQKQDKKRITYHSYFTSCKWGRAADYDLCLNSDRGIDLSAKIIQMMVDGL